MTAIIASALLATSAATGNPWLAEWNTPYGMPPFKELKVSGYVDALKTAVDLKQKRIQAIVENKEKPTFQNTVAPYVFADRELTQASRVFGVLLSLERNEEREKASIEAIPVFTADAAKTISNIKETVARGARVILITDPGMDAKEFKYVIRIPEMRPELMAVPSAVLTQLFAYYAAKEKGCDIDKPRNLAKSVTVE
jgi:hypothetical protein